MLFLFSVCGVITFITLMTITIRFIGYDEETYSLQLLNQKEPKILHYHDLQKLLVSSGILNSVKVLSS